MDLLARIALLSWPLIALLCFAILRSRHAALVILLVGWSFLPIAVIDLPGLAAFDKTAAVGAALFLGLAVFAPRRLSSLRPHWIDAPIATLCLVPFLSSLANGLGPYDGLSGAFRQSVQWGAPWIVGRACFAYRSGHRALNLGILLAGLAYLPLVLLELRFSPQLHRLVYGEHQHSFAQTMRFGGWRPTVFQHHGLMLGMWMAAACICGYCLWRSRSVQRLFGIPLLPVLCLLFVITLLCKSTGALLLMLLGLLALELGGSLRWRWPMLALLVIPIAYITARGTGAWNGGELIEFASWFGSDRAQSVKYRIDNESILVQRALQRPWFGWSGWGRPNTVYLPGGGSYMIVIDGLWVLMLGMHGLVGLTAFAATLTLPVIAALRRLPAKAWLDRRGAPTTGLAILTALFFADGLMNAMLNPVFLVAAGGLAGYATLPRTRAAKHKERDRLADGAGRRGNALGSPA